MIELAAETRQGLAALVPAHNERERVEPTLELLAGLAQAGFLDVVCVVSHRSDDGTAEFAAGFDSSFKVIESNLPGRKDTPLMVGLSALMGYASIFTFDADLQPADNARQINDNFARRMIEEHHLSDGKLTIVSPLTNGWYSSAVPLGGLSGQRILPAELVLDMPFSGLNGWGFEIKTSLAAWQRGALAVENGGPGHAPKGEKHGFVDGWVRNFEMGRLVVAAAREHLRALDDPNGYLSVDEALSRGIFPSDQPNVDAD